MYFESGISPPILNNSNKSKNYPWISPHTVTGDETGYTFDSLYIIIKCFKLLLKIILKL